MKDTKQANLLFTLAVWCVLFAGGMIGIWKIASEKTILITDAGQEQIDAPDLPMSADQQPEESVLLLQEDGIREHVWKIPLQKDIKAENVVMENRYMDKELWIYIKCDDQNFYDKNAIYGNTEYIDYGYFENKPDGVMLKMKMSQVLEYRSTMENNTLLVEFFEPRELYEQIVVIDPVGGGTETGLQGNGYTEKDLALQVAKALQKMVIAPRIKLYYTRTEDVSVSEEQRMALADMVDADMFLSIGVSADTEVLDNYGISCLYNDTYFIPQFGNVEFADIVTRKVTLSSSNRAVGLAAAPGDSILRRLQIPAAELCVGYVSNEKESGLLGQESYREKLAAGIADALTEVYNNYITTKTE